MVDFYPDGLKQKNMECNRAVYSLEYEDVCFFCFPSLYSSEKGQWHQFGCFFWRFYLFLVLGEVGSGTPNIWGGTIWSSLGVLFTRCLFFGAHGLDTRKQAHHLNGGEKTSPLQKFESPTLPETIIPRP